MDKRETIIISRRVIRLPDEERKSRKLKRRGKKKRVGTGKRSSLKKGNRSSERIRTECSRGESLEEESKLSKEEP